jgi:hypothetical protein
MIPRKEDQGQEVLWFHDCVRWLSRGLGKRSPEVESTVSGYRVAGDVMIQIVLNT